jgi:hypothetical protein
MVTKRSPKGGKIHHFAIGEQSKISARNINLVKLRQLESEILEILGSEYLMIGFISKNW